MSHNQGSHRNLTKVYQDKITSFARINHVCLISLYELKIKQNLVYYHKFHTPQIKFD